MERVSATRPDPDSTAFEGLASGFFRWASFAPERVALEVEGRTFTYDALARRASAIADAILAGDGGSDASLTAVLGSRSVTAYAAILGVLASGRGYVPLNPSYPPARNRAILERSGCRSIVVAEEGAAGAVLDELLAEFEEPLVLVVPDSIDKDAMRESLAPHDFAVVPRSGSDPRPHAAAARPEDSAYLLFTSGSTGAPKGVLVSHGNVRAFLDAAGERYTLTPDDRLSQTFDLTFDLSVFDMFLAWEHGARVCCPTSRDLIKPSDFVKRSELTVWFSVPSLAMLMQRLRALRPGAFPSLRWSLFCGEALPIDVARAWAQAAPNSRVENLYGPTEATIACTAYAFDPTHSEAEAAFGIVPIGYPMGETTTRVVAVDSTTEVSAGEEGELLVGGPQVVSGYWRDPAASKRSFTELDGQRYYRTGDRVRSGAPSQPLNYLGRMDDQIKVLGHRVELGEVEAVLRDEAEAPAAAIGWPRTASGAAGIVGFVADPSADAVLIRRRVADRLPDYMVPREIYIVEKLPLNANGKCDRNALIELLAT